MDERKIYAGLVVLALVLVIFAAFTPRDTGPSVKDLIAQEVAPISDTVAALGDRVEGVESTLGEISEQVSAAATSDDLAALSAQVDDAVAQTATLGDEISTLEQTLNDATEAMAAAPAPDTATTTATSDPVETPAAKESEAEEFVDGEPGFMPGQTALFDDGNLRLFISRLDPRAKAVRVSVQGQLKTLTVDQGRTFAVGADYCRVTVSGVSGNGAVMDAICGDDLPAAEGLGIGKTTILADGALRVFASRVTEDHARLSVNGELLTLGVGRSAPMAAGEENCRVYLDAVDRGHASVSALCGEDVPVSEVAGPGSTVLLNDGAVRVFVGSVRDDAVRFSVNGQTLISGASGHSHDVGDNCAVVVEDVVDGKASFSHTCEG